MTSHVLFDFFGTLVEYSASRTQQGYEQSHLLLSRAGSDLNYEGFLTRWSAHCDEFERKAQPRGIEALLAQLAGRFELAIITNTHDPALVPNHLGRMGVASLFPTVVTSVEFGLRKPNPAIFEHTLEILGVAAEDCVYVGDNFEADYLGARSAGIRPLLIDPSRKHAVPESARLTSIFELEHVLPTIA